MPFKCKTCHEYGHFAIFFPKKAQLEEGETPKQDQKEVHKRKGSKARPSQTSPTKKKSNENKFEALKIVEDEEAVAVEKDRGR